SSPASSVGSSPRTTARRAAAGSTPSDSRIACATRSQAAAWGSAGEEPAEDEREDATVAKVLALARRVESHARAELDLVRPHRHLARLAVLDAGDRIGLATGQAERVGALAVRELQRQHAHHQQVRAVDPLVRL